MKMSSGGVDFATVVRFPDEHLRAIDFFDGVASDPFKLVQNRIKW